MERKKQYFTPIYKDPITYYLAGAMFIGTCIFHFYKEVYPTLAYLLKNGFLTI